MKKISVLTLLALSLSLIFATNQALARSSAIGPNKSPGPPTGVGPHNTPGAQATSQAGKHHGPPQIFRGTLSAVSPTSLSLTLGDGSSVTIGLTSDTKIKVPGPKAQGDTLLVGMQVVAMAYTDESNNLVARAVMVIPGKPLLVHRVGTVTAYTAGASISIQATDGNTYTFTLDAATKILPASRAGDLAVGSLVTIIAPRDPSSLVWAAMGIVVHP